MTTPPWRAASAIEAGGLGPQPDQFGDLVGRAVIKGQVVAGVEHAAGHRLSHAAEPDEADSHV